MSHEADHQHQGSDGTRPGAGRGHDEHPTGPAEDTIAGEANSIDDGNSGLVERSRTSTRPGNEEPVSGNEIVAAEITEALADEIPRIVQRTVRTTHSVATSWQGPMPQPSDFESYERTLPGSADRILRMAEKALDSQIDTDKTLAHGDVDAVRRGQFLSTAVVVVTLGIALTLAILGAPWGVVSLFVAPTLFQFATSLIRSVREPSDKSPKSTSPAAPDDDES